MTEPELASLLHRGRRIVINNDRELQARADDFSTNFSASAQRNGLAR